MHAHASCVVEGKRKTCARPRPARQGWVGWVAGWLGVSSPLGIGSGQAAAIAKGRQRRSICQACSTVSCPNRGGGGENDSWKCARCFEILYSHARTALMALYSLYSSSDMASLLRALDLSCFSRSFWAAGGYTRGRGVGCGDGTGGKWGGCGRWGICPHGRGEGWRGSSLVRSQQSCQHIKHNTPCHTHHHHHHPATHRPPGCAAAPPSWRSSRPAPPAPCSAS